jgi:copper chaperone CopZ
VKHVKEALEAINGVKSAKVKLKEKAAVVDHADAVGLDPQGRSGRSGLLTKK